MTLSAKTPTAPETWTPSLAHPPKGTWTPWYSLSNMLRDGEIPTLADHGAYVFRFSPRARAREPVGQRAAIVHLGGMTTKGSLYRRIGTFIGAALGTGLDPGPSHSGGLTFAATRQGQCSVLDLDLAFVVAPPSARDYCAEVAALEAYEAAGVTIPGRHRYSCGCAGRLHARWFKAPPMP